MEEFPARNRGSGPVAIFRMEAPPRGNLGRVDGAVSHDERSEELGIFVTVVV
jgi:hypothetical protein